MVGAAVVVDATLVAVEAVLADVVDAVVVSGSGFAASPPLLPKMFGKFRLLGKNNLGALVVVVWVEAVVAVAAVVPWLGKISLGALVVVAAVVPVPVVVAVLVAEVVAVVVSCFRSNMFAKKSFDTRP